MSRTQRAGLFVVLIIAAVGGLAYYLGARNVFTGASFGTQKMQVPDALSVELEQIRSA